MGTQQFCLKWNNHQTNMLTFFKYLLSNEAFVDVTLACEGLSLKAHKIVLSACSPFFQNLFLENTSKHPIVIINGMRYIDLKSIIDFMYRGEINVSQDQLSSLFKAAETLKVIGLAEVTTESSSILKGQEDESQSYFSNQSDNIPSKRAKSPTTTRKSQKKVKKKHLSGFEYSDGEDQRQNKITKSFGYFSEDDSDQNLPNSYLPNSSTYIPFSSSLPTNETAVAEAANNNCFDIEPSKIMEQTLKIDDGIFPGDGPMTLTPSCKAKSSSVHYSEMPKQCLPTETVTASSAKTTTELSISSPISDNSSQDMKLCSFSQEKLNTQGIATHSSQSLSIDTVSVIAGPSNYFMDKQSSSHQQISEDEDGIFVCSVCEKQFPKLANLKWHYHRAHSTKQFPCRICSKPFKTRDLMNQHSRVHWPDSFRCNHCGETFRWRSSLKAHKQKVHETKAS